MKHWLIKWTNHLSETHQRRLSEGQFTKWIVWYWLEFLVAFKASHLTIPHLICIINLYEWIWDASIKCIGLLSKSLKRKSDEVGRIWTRIFIWIDTYVLDVAEIIIIGALTISRVSTLYFARILPAWGCWNGYLCRNHRSSETLKIISV